MSKHFDIIWTNQFKKDYKSAMKRHLDIDLLDNIMVLSITVDTISQKIYKPDTSYYSTDCLNCFCKEAFTLHCRAY